MNWRLEAGGPIEFFAWDQPGRIAGHYGVRYPVFTIYPVYEHADTCCGFAINARPTPGTDTGRLSAVEARMDCQLYVRSTSPQAVIEGLRSVQGQPRIEEYRPGLAPTAAYFDVIEGTNRHAYFESRGVNQYIGPGWNPGSLEQAFRDPTIRALWIGHPNRPTATPEPEAH